MTHLNCRPQLTVLCALASLLLWSSQALADSEACGAAPINPEASCEILFGEECLQACGEDEPYPSYQAACAFENTECAASCSSCPDQNCELCAAPTCTDECQLGCSTTSSDAFECNGYCTTVCAESVCADVCHSEELDCFACESLCTTECQAACAECTDDSCSVCAPSCEATCTAEGKLAPPYYLSCQREALPPCAELLAQECQDSCNTLGALYCDGQYIHVENQQDCLDYLDSIGTTVRFREAESLGGCGLASSGHGPPARLPASLALLLLLVAARRRRSSR